MSDNLTSEEVDQEAADCYKGYTKHGDTAMGLICFVGGRILETLAVILKKLEDMSTKNDN